MNIFRNTGLALLLALAVPQTQAADAVKVNIAPFSEIATYPLRSAPATVVSLNATAIAAEIPAKIVKFNARVGDIVEKDQELVSLKCIDFEIEQEGARARLESLDARIELAKRRLQRTKKLTMKQSVSEELLDERESDLAVLTADRLAARASYNLSRVHVATCVIKSPFRALVTERTSALGNYAEVGKPLLRILDIEDLEVSAQVNSNDVEQMKLVNDLKFSHGGDAYPVNVRSILPSINSETRNREVRLLFENGPALPGAAGKLIWRDQRAHVPGNLIVQRDGHLGVFLFENGRARFVALPEAQAGRASPSEIPLSAKLITVGHFGLNDNDAVLSE